MASANECEMPKTAHIPETTKENDPMLDVHPPHGSTHSWKDFFIHIATICVGLLIAIGLEQTVEAIHHHHQREYLEEQMHEESERNLKLIEEQIVYATKSKQYLEQCEQALESAPVNAGTVTVTLPVDHTTGPASGILISPSRGTWTVAKAAGTVALLPPETAKIYARLDLAAEFEQISEERGTPALHNLESMQRSTRVLGRAGSPVRMTVNQRDQLLHAFDQYQRATDDFIFRLAILRGAVQAVLGNIHELNEMYAYQQRAVKELAP